MQDLSIVVIAAGTTRRMRGDSPRSALPLDKEVSLLSRQLMILKSEFPEAPVVLVVGYGSGLVTDDLPSGVHVVPNNQFSNTNDSCSISIGLQALPAMSTLVVYGDMVFTAEVGAIVGWRSTLNICENSPSKMCRSVGVSSCGGSVRHIDYGLKPYWGMSVYLDQKERELFLVRSQLPHKFKYFAFELLNEVMDAGGKFYSRVQKTPAIEVDTDEDYLKAKLLHRRHPARRDLCGY